MTKRAIVVTLNSNICELIIKGLNKECEDMKEVKEFLNSIEELANQEYESIILNFEKENINCVNNDYIIRCENLFINTKERTVYYDDKLIELTPKEYDILYLLIQNKGKVYSKSEIYSIVWKEKYSFDDNNIMAHINKLRKKIEPNPKKPIFIKTVWGVGYKFNSEVN
ncbi:Alkaline phosphatase synthesis transcriptional regulatory protein phoP [uncultured Clostridium sp.]|uniref:winged helix-turn-helix domain-containing protein n=1 Tax=uncultured Clostridium sp. TaxID=59620 RepID=UPI0008215F87|nr:winged helix-turn-helix domain-containing protein [uncultured Clostridium sp.]SCI73023.1 Alkaline phosphatase synthesis transcriptional regulatory protein phoP [uncultured Clostridium sp.]